MSHRNDDEPCSTFVILTKNMDVLTIEFNTPHGKQPAVKYISREVAYDAISLIDAEDAEALGPFTVSELGTS